MENKLFQIQGQIVKINSQANRSLRLTIDSQEALSDTTMSRIMPWFERHGWFTFCAEPIDPSLIAKLPPTDFDKHKTPAQRLRGVLFVLWEQKGKQGDFDSFYRLTMEKFIDSVKEKLT